MPDIPLSLQTYQAEAQKTDRTRGSKGQEFLLLGLFGESGTLMDEVKKKQRDTRSYVGYERSVVEELGDVLWYLSNIADRAGLSLSAIARNAMQQQFSSFNDVGTTLNFSTIQPQQHLPLNAPTPAFERTLKAQSRKWIKNSVGKLMYVVTERYGQGNRTKYDGK
jgi:NTP pyrophosphatase (non-canonical NTP hydrolase)